MLGVSTIVAQFYEKCVSFKQDTEWIWARLSVEMSAMLDGQGSTIFAFIFVISHQWDASALVSRSSRIHRSLAKTCTSEAAHSGGVLVKTIAADQTTTLQGSAHEVLFQPSPSIALIKWCVFWWRWILVWIKIQVRGGLHQPSKVLAKIYWGEKGGTEIRSISVTKFVGHRCVRHKREHNWSLPGPGQSCKSCIN